MQFRTKARAVDLLGKGQIADLPTAITELWKNGYDAYADNLTAELYLSSYKDTVSPIFLITDDGTGMSRKDIFKRWLVLGTDSKSRTNEIKDDDTLGKKTRVKAGEKGIGRLSVAYLGSPMLMLTKKQGFALQALYFDWRLLENYNLFLEDIEIPACDIIDINDFENAIYSLRDEFLKNLERKEDSEGNAIWEKSQDKLLRSIKTESENLYIPKYFESEVLTEMLNVEKDHGTKFIIFNPEDQIIDLLNDDPDISGKEVLRSSIAGFTNQFKDNPLPIKTSFPIHKKIGNDYDFFTSSGAFFTPKDYDLADIIIEGTFDGKGNFTGSIKIYDDEPFDYSHVSSRKKDHRNDYGDFYLKVGYSMGIQGESKLNKQIWDKLRERIEDYGGLYIYRDGFRVLPYGRTEYDFLEFERKRALKAGESFWSHRRMYGYIELTRNGNPELKDKAGREGLINNAAYRAFKTDLEGVFDDLALNFFGSRAKDKSLFVDRKKILKEQHEEIKKDKEREKEEKRLFTNELKKYPARFDEYSNKYKTVLQKLENKVQSAGVIYTEIESLLNELNRLDLEYTDLLPKIPKRYEPTETQLDRLSDFENKLHVFNDTLLPQKEIILSEVKKKLEIKELKLEFDNSYRLYRSQLEDILYKSKEKLSSKIRTLSAELDSRSFGILNELEADKKKLSDEIKSKDDVVLAIEKIRDKHNFLREQIYNELTPLTDHVERLSFDIDEELLQGAYKAEYESIKYQWEQTRETAQLGVAIEIIDHEFNTLYSQINNSIKKLEEDKNNKDHFDQVKYAFNQLEQKYALLSPLYRVSGATPKNVSGASINEYIHNFFKEKLKDEGIYIDSTESFKNYLFHIKEPTIHTVFINIINNAIYWLRNSKVKKIILDYRPQTKEIIIANSGTKIEKHRLEKIFDLFYSNRPNGRGIGLYLAKQSLQESYYDIYSTNDPDYNLLDGACFVIKPQ